MVDVSVPGVLVMHGLVVIRKPVRLILSGQGRRFETVLDEGKFEFHFVPPGTYTLSAIGAGVVKIMSSRSRGRVVHDVTVDQQTDVSSLAVILRIKRN